MREYDVSNKQKGRLGEVLLTGHVGYATEIVEDWIESDVRTDSAVSQADPIRVTHDHRIETYYVEYEGEHMSWTPDCLFTAWVAKGFGPLQSSDERRIDYPVEVKTGDYAELERNQHVVMELLATRESIQPVHAAVDLTHLPERFGLDLTAVDPRDSPD
jgi:hypothetical protein